MKKCPNCGSMQKETAHFCSKCRYQFADTEKSTTTEVVTGPIITPTPKAGSVDKVKNVSLGYWRWLTRSAKHPSDNSLIGNKFYGLTSISLISLFVTIGIMRPVAHASSAATGAMSWAENSLTSGLFGQGSSYVSDSVDNSMSGVIAGTSVRLFLAILAIYFVIYTGAFLARRAISQRKDGYFETMTIFGQRISLVVFTSCAAAIIGLIGSISGLMLAMILIIFGLAVTNVGFYEFIMTGAQRSRLDVIYVAIITNFCIGICDMIIFGVLGRAIFSVISNAF